MSGLNANYATEAGSAQSAKTASEAAHAAEAGHAEEADHSVEAKHADSAIEAEKATNSTYAVVSKEAERLNLAGDGIAIVTEGHYLIFLTPGLKPEQCLMIDLAHRYIINAQAITDPEGTPYQIQTPSQIEMVAEALEDYF
jgi:predicted  nucleic acid-binding Zn-ribbon protein